jgi:hypothetical protein
MKDIYGFIHIAVMGDYWESIINDQLNSIVNSGLKEASKKIFACVVGSKEVPVLQDVEIIDRSFYVKLGELFTLRQLKKFCDLNSDCNVWYIHTKGASYYNFNQTCWRKYMEYFVIENWRDCIKALETHDVCGVEWEKFDPERNKVGWGWDNGKPLEDAFSGNFWWATSNYIQKLPENVADHDKDRWKAEYHFIGEASPKVKCFHNAYMNLYENAIVESMYKKK